ncbi:hypothetical protein GGI12_004412 [Dipsacomyces acuminosporus]|nr:hypothetical protein GGI12_004412 [Dipsacomyces acuminosporus]
MDDTDRDKRELAIIWVCSSVLFINLLLLVYVYTQRSYIPLKVKNLPLMYLSFVSMVCWFIGSVYVNQSSYLAKNWAICVVTNLWVRMSFGTYFLVALVQMRVYEYIVIFRWKRRATGRYLWIPVAYEVTFPLIYGILGTALPHKSGMEYDPESRMCRTGHTLYIIGYTYLGFQFVITAYLAYKARKINACFNEFKDITTILVCTFVSMLITCILHFLKPSVRESFGVHAISTLVMFAFTQVHFFVILARPIYHSIFDREQHLDYFLRTMGESGLTKQYQMGTTEKTGATGAPLTKTTIITSTINSQNQNSSYYQQMYSESDSDSVYRYQQTEFGRDAEVASYHGRQII